MSISTILLGLSLGAILMAGPSHQGCPPIGCGYPVITTCSEEFRAAALATHNQLRARHYAPPLEFNPNLDAYAQKWSDYLASTGQLVTQPNTPYGINVLRAPTLDNISGAFPVQYWYRLVRNYHYYGGEPNQAEFKQWSTFTQVVWRNVTWLGLGCSERLGQVYVTAYYYPPGNVPCRYAENVLRPCGNNCGF